MGRPPALLSLLLLVCASVTCAAGSASASKARSRAASGTACATQNGERTGGSQARHCMAGEKRNDDKQELLLVTRLTGHISAIDAATGDVKWDIDTGGDLITAGQTESSPGDQSSNALDHGLIPARDGSLLSALPSGLHQLPFRIQDIVPHLPIRSHDHILVGSQTTNAFAIHVKDGRLVHLAPGSFPAPAALPASMPAEDVLWMVRTDYVVRAYSAVHGHAVWNVTYGVVKPLSPLSPLGPNAHVQTSPAPGSTDTTAASASAAGAEGGGSPAPWGVDGSLLPLLTTSLEGDVALTAMHPSPSPSHPNPSTTTDSGTGSGAESGGKELAAPLWRVRLSQEKPGPVVSVHRVRVSSGSRGMEAMGTGMGMGMGRGVGTDGHGQGLVVAPMPYAEVWPAGDGSAAGAEEGEQVYLGFLPHSGQLYAAQRGPLTLLQQAQGEGTAMATVHQNSCLAGSSRCSSLPFGLYPVKSTGEGIGLQQGDRRGQGQGSMGDTLDLDLEAYEEVLPGSTDGFFSSAGSRALVPGGGLSSLPLPVRQWLEAGSAVYSQLLQEQRMPALTTLGPRSALPAPTVWPSGAPGPANLPPSSSSPSLMSWGAPLYMWLAPLPLAHKLAVAALVAFVILTAATAVWVRLRSASARVPDSAVTGVAEPSLPPLSSPSPSLLINTAATASPAPSTPLERAGPDGAMYRQVVPGSKLWLCSERVLGTGSQGTVVYEGLLDGRRVAVKRLLRTFYPTADREVSLLVRIDGHPSVVRYYFCEEGHADFLFLALELCETTLAQQLLTLSGIRLRAGRAAVDSKEGSKKKKGVKQSAGGSSALTPVPEVLVHKGAAGLEGEEGGEDADEVGEWSTVQGKGVPAAASTANKGSAAGQQPLGRLPPMPSPFTRDFLLRIVQGVAHLHAHGVVHRDLKPHNILLARLGQGETAGSKDGRTTDVARVASLVHYEAENHQFGRSLYAKISDFGLSKLMDSAASASASTSAHAASKGAGGMPASALQFLRGAISSGYRRILQRHVRVDGDGAAGDGHGVTSSTAPGTIGWQAPELVAPVLLGTPAARPNTQTSSEELDTWLRVLPRPLPSASGSRAGQGAASTSFRLASAADVWSLACVLYSALDPDPTETGTGHGHPYGAPWERESSIIRHFQVGSVPRMERLLASAPEAHNLLTQMLSPFPDMRPSAACAAEHPFFWSDAKRLSFLCAVSDRCEDEQEGSPLLQALQGIPLHDIASSNADVRALSKLTAGWHSILPRELVQDTQAGRHRRYNTLSVVDLLRMIRNRIHHWRDLSVTVRREVLGSEEDTSVIIQYILARERFPRLLMAVYWCVCASLAHECAESSGPRAAGQASGWKPYLQADVAAVWAAYSRSRWQTFIQGRRLVKDKARLDAMDAQASFVDADDSVEASRSAGGDESRAWYADENAWMQKCTDIWHRCLSSTGAPLLVETTDVDGADFRPPQQPTGGVSATAIIDSLQPRHGIVRVICAHARMSESLFRGGAHVRHEKYKCAPCKDWDVSGGAGCPRGSRCDFAHGPIELRRA